MSFTMRLFLIAAAIGFALTGCSTEEHLRFSAQSSGANPSKMTSVAVRFAQSNGLTAASSFPRRSKHLMLSVLADYRDRQAPNIRLTVVEFDGDLDASLTERRRFASTSSFRYEVLCGRLRRDFHLAYGNGIDIETFRFSTYFKYP